MFIVRVRAGSLMTQAGGTAPRVTTVAFGVATLLDAITCGAMAATVKSLLGFPRSATVRLMPDKGNSLIGIPGMGVGTL